MNQPLSEYAASNEIRNVLIYVSDALRYDRLPAQIRDLGVTAKAIAPSTYTASSLPSIFTGKYPATHRIWRFQDQLPERPPLLAGEDFHTGFDAGTVWIELESADKPPLRIHRVEEESTLEDLEEPFVHVIHDVGPHAPYGFENGVFESTKDFFEQYKGDRRRLIELYEEDCVNSAKRFLPVFERIREEGLLDDTLVIYTSDHGQALGEVANGGVFGHGYPMVPETVEVPIVFIGAGLPEGKQYDPLLSSTDIAPTALRAQDRAIPEDVEGKEVWTDVPNPTRKLRSDVWQHKNVTYQNRDFTLNAYAATSVWDDSGGRVFHRKSTPERFAYVMYSRFFRGSAPAWRANWTMRKQLRILDMALSPSFTYGAPKFSSREAKQLLPGEFVERRYSRSDGATEFSEEQREQLKNLGYI